MIYVVGRASSTGGFGGGSDSTSGFVSVIDGTTNKVIENFPVAAASSSLSVNPQTNMIYVVGRNSSTSGFVSVVIDGTTNELVKNITMDSDVTPTDIDVNPRTNIIYVVGRDSSKDGPLINEQRSIRQSVTDGFGSDSTSGFVSVINGTTNQIIENITTDSDVASMSVVVNPQTNKVYVTGYLSFDPNSSFVSVIDGTTNEVENYNPLINIGSSDGLDLNPNTNLIYVFSSSSESVSVINGTTNRIMII
jgi:DNA-binding beta-propeller fold protein YncE